MKPTTILLFSFLLLCATASAQVYKRVGPDGQVYFSDQPGPGAEPVELSPPQIISMPPLPERKPGARRQGGDATKQADDGFAGYTGFSVLSPTNSEAYRANDGNITVRISENEVLRVLVDNLPMAIYARDANLRLIYANHGWEELTGIPVDNALGN